MIDALDFVPYRILAWDSDYLYAIRYEGAASYIYRLAARTDEPTEPRGSIPGQLVRCMWASPDYLGTMLARTQDHIYKTVDGGANWGNNSPAFDNGQPIFRLGGIGTPELVGGGIGVLHRGVTWDGENVYLAEYSQAPGRIAGGYNDAVRLLRSTDRGTTWSVAGEWNTNGAHQIRHLHSVQAHGGYLYIQAGDENYESGILRWNPLEPLESNKLLSEYPHCWSGAQRYRTGDILFPPGDYMYWMADSSMGDAISPDRGIWRGRKDMTGTPERIDSQILRHWRHSGWYGVILPNGSLVFSEFLEADAVGERIFFYGSTDGATWEVCASYGMEKTGRGGADVFFVWPKDGAAYFTKPLHSGKAPLSASVALTPKAFDPKLGARIVHPVYWVGQTGVDTAIADQGLRPDRPWRSLPYALTGSRITHGARVVVGAGLYELAEPIAAEWDANPQPPIQPYSVTIEGGASESTVLRLPGADTLADVVTGEAVQVQNVWLEKPMKTETKSGVAVMARPVI